MESGHLGRFFGVVWCEVVDKVRFERQVSCSEKFKISAPLRETKNLKEL